VIEGPDGVAADHPGAPRATPAHSRKAGLGAGLYLDGAHDHYEVPRAPGFGDNSGSRNLTEVEAQRLIDSDDTKKLVGGTPRGSGVRPQPKG
jgi:hypothetical protein